MILLVASQLMCFSNEGNAFASGCASQRRGCSRKAGLQCPFSSLVSSGIGRCLAYLLLTFQKTWAPSANIWRERGWVLLGTQAVAEKTANVNSYLYYWSISPSKQVGKGANLSNLAKLWMQEGSLGKHPCELPMASCLCPFSHLDLQKLAGSGMPCLSLFRREQVLAHGVALAPI